MTTYQMLIDANSKKYVNDDLKNVCVESDCLSFYSCMGMI